MHDSRGLGEDPLTVDPLIAAIAAAGLAALVPHASPAARTHGHGAPGAIRGNRLEPAHRREDARRLLRCAVAPGHVAARGDRRVPPRVERLAGRESRGARDLGSGCDAGSECASSSSARGPPSSTWRPGSPRRASRGSPIGGSSQRCSTGGIVLLDPVTGAVVERWAAGSAEDAATTRTRRRFLMLVSGRRVSRLSVVDATGRLRRLSLRIPADAPAGRRLRPALVADPRRERAYVLMDARTVIDIDLRRMRVRRLRLRPAPRPVERAGRFELRRWEAIWLGGGRLALAGHDLVSRPGGRSRTVPAGLSTIDTRSGTVTRIDAGADGRDPWRRAGCSPTVFAESADTRATAGACSRCSAASASGTSTSRDVSPTPAPGRPPT